MNLGGNADPVAEAGEIMSLSSMVTKNLRRIVDLQIGSNGLRTGACNDEHEYHQHLGEHGMVDSVIKLKDQVP